MTMPSLDSFAGDDGRVRKIQDPNGIPTPHQYRLLAALVGAPPPTPLVMTKGQAAWFIDDVLSSGPTARTAMPERPQRAALQKRGKARYEGLLRYHAEQRRQRDLVDRANGERIVVALLALNEKDPGRSFDYAEIRRYSRVRSIKRSKHAIAWAIDAGLIEARKEGRYSTFVLTNRVRTWTPHDSPVAIAERRRRAPRPGDSHD